MNKPYVSVVIVGRNDDYGDDFVGRINTFVRSLDHQIRDSASLWELIIVEWNPLADRAALADIIQATANLTVRVISVPASLHDSLGSTSAVLEFHAKNVGIRRAQGEFVLVANPDILFSPVLIDEIARQRLRSDTVYRTDRYDFVTEGIKDVPAADLVDFALARTFVVHAVVAEHSVSLPVEQPQRQWQELPRSQVRDGVWHTNGCGDFMLAARESFFTVRGLYETLEHRWHVDSISLLRFAKAKKRQQVLLAPQCVFHQHHERREQDIAYQALDVMALASRPGTTEWGFKDQVLQETLISPLETK